MLRSESSGLNRLDKLARNADELSKRTEITADELFNQEFMSSCTQFTDFTDFVRAGGFTLNSSEDFKAIPDEAFDDYIRQNTRFSNWREMQLAAGRTWAKRQLLK